ncbi:MAG TPA: hypothetical protein VLE44_00380 [Candidatus Saccharimonadales bacterium]|nr:hypothetical protein [Candidatus Saccharimonadales bacterium]
MNERPGKEAPKTKTVPNRPTLPLVKTPDTGSLTPEIGTNSSVLTTIREIHRIFAISSDEAFVDAIIALADDPNLDNVNPDELIKRTVYTFLKDARLEFQKLNSLGIPKDILEKRRNERKKSDNSNE